MARTNNRQPATRNAFPLFELLWGAALGVLLWLAAREIGFEVIPGMHHDHLVILWAGVAGAVGLTRARGLLRAATILAAAAILLIGYLLPVPGMVRAWSVADPVERLEVVVILSGDVRGDGTPSSQAQLRLLRGYELLGEGAARRLVITRVAPPRRSTLPAVRQQMARLGLDAPVEEVGPVRNTREEALAVAELARARGWKRILLVTDPLHLRRAGAVFAAAGLDPVRVPCRTRTDDLLTYAGPGTNWNLFRDWLYEAVGYRVYQWRGWVP